MGSGEPEQVDALKALAASELGHGVPQRTVPLDLAVAIGAGQEHAGAAEFQGRMCKQL